MPWTEKVRNIVGSLLTSSGKMVEGIPQQKPPEVREFGEIERLVKAGGKLAQAVNAYEALGILPEEKVAFDLQMAHQLGKMLIGTKYEMPAEEIKLERRLRSVLEKHFSGAWHPPIPSHDFNEISFYRALSYGAEHTVSSIGLRVTGKDASVSLFFMSLRDYVSGSSPADDQTIVNNAAFGVLFNPLPDTHLLQRKKADIASKRPLRATTSLHAAK